MSAQVTEITPAPAPSGRASALRRRLPGSLAWHIGSLALLAVILYPVIWVVGGSFKKSEDIVEGPPAGARISPSRRRPGLGARGR